MSAADAVHLIRICTKRPILPKTLLLVKNCQKFISLKLFYLVLLGDFSLYSFCKGMPSPKTASSGLVTFLAEMHLLCSLISFQIVPFVLKIVIELEEEAYQ